MEYKKKKLVNCILNELLHYLQMNLWQKKCNSLLNNIFIRCTYYTTEVLLAQEVKR